MAAPPKTLPADFDFAEPPKTLPADFAFDEPATQAAAETAPAAQPTAQPAAQPTAQPAAQPAVAAGPQPRTFFEQALDTARSAGGVGMEVVRRLGAAVAGPGTALGEIVQPILDPAARNVPARSPLEAPPFINFSALGLEDVTPTAVGRGLVQGAQDIASSLTSPLNLVLGAASGGFGMLQGPARTALARLASAGFSADMLRHALEQVPEFRQAVEAGDVQGATRALTNIGGSAAFSAMTGRHALEPTLRPEQPPVRSTLQPSKEGVIRAMTNEELLEHAQQAPQDRRLVNQEIERRRQLGQMERPQPERLNRAQRRASILPPETGEPEPEAPVATPSRTSTLPIRNRLEEISRELGLGPYSQLSPENRAIVQRIRFEEEQARRRPARQVRSQQQPEPAQAPPEERRTIEPVEEQAPPPRVLDNIPEERPISAAESEAAPIEAPALASAPEPTAATAQTVAPAPPTAPPPPTEPRAPKRPPVYGRDTEIRVPGEPKRYRAVYALREAEDIQPSHNPFSFEANPNYEFRNDRNYVEPQNAERIIKRVAEFDPVFLVNDNPTAENGPPIIDSRGNVLGGNSRTMTLARVEQQNPEAMRQYREQIAREAARFGLDPNAVRRMERPILVREIIEDLPDPQAAITDFNKVGTAELRIAERAIADSRRVSLETLEAITRRIEEEGPEGTLAKALEGDARPLVERLVDDGVITTQEKPRLLNANGTLTQEGKARISRLLLGRLFEDARHFDETAPSLRNKLERIIAPLVRVEGIEGWDITEHVKQAVRIADEAQKRDMSVDELVSQGALFGDRGYSDQAIAIARVLERKPTLVARSFRQYAAEADLSRAEQGMLGMEPPTPEDSFRAAFIDPPPPDPMAERGAEYQAKQAVTAGESPAAPARRRQSRKKSSEVVAEPEAVETAPPARRSRSRKKIDEAIAKPEAVEPAPAAKAKRSRKQSEEVIAKLEAVETAARKRIRRRVSESSQTLSSGPGLALEQLADYAVVGAAKLAKGTVKFADWSAEMVEEFGEQIRPYLGRLYAQANRLAREQSGGERRREPLVTSPSYEKTSGNILRYTSPEVQRAMAERLRDFEARNPERKKVTFQEVIDEARSLGLGEVLSLDPKKLKAGDTLNPAVRFAARETLNGLNQEIVDRRKRLAEQAGTLTEEARKAEEERIEALEEDARRLVDVLIPTRSQDGRNLAYHRMVAEQSFDIVYWLSRAKRAMAIPETSDLPKAEREKLEEILAEGQDAESKAIEKVSKRKRRERVKREAEEQARREIEAEEQAAQPTPEELQDPALQEAQQLREKARRIRETRKRETAKESTDAEPQEPQALQVPGKGKAKESTDAEPQEPQALQVPGKGKRKRRPLTREEQVERARRAFINRLRRQAKGDLVRVSPVTPEERALWENDPEVIELRAKIAELRAQRKREKQARIPTSEEKKARYKKRVLELIEKKLRGESTERPPSKWELTPEERREVDNDPEVRAARMKLALHMRRLERTGWLDALVIYRRAGLLTGPRTMIRNVGGNLSFQVLEEIQRIPSAIVDSAIAVFGTGRRTITGPDVDAMRRAAYEAATRGMREAGEIMRQGATGEQLAQLDYAREANTGNRVFDTAVNTVLRFQSAQDRVFKVYAYERALAEQMKLAGVSTPTDQMRVAAWEAANFATFNNPNLTADWIQMSKGWLRRRGPAGRAFVFGIDMFVPFVRTPANIVARVIDYTPVGGSIRAANAIYNAMKDRGFKPEQQRAFSEAIGRGLTGSALLWLGWWMADRGMMTGLRDDDRGLEGTAEAAGRMPGSVLVDDKWRRIDSISPLGNLLVLGATLQREQNRSAEALVLTGGKTVLEQPLMQGTKEFLESVQDPEGRARSITASMAASFIPTGVADIAAARDTVRRDTRAQTLRGMVKAKVAERIPGLRETLPPRRDVLGQVQPQTSPIDATIGTQAKELTDPVMREMVRNKVEIGRGSRMEGESDADFGMRQEAIGDAIKLRVARLIQRREYQAADQEERKQMIQGEIASVRRRAANLVRLRRYRESKDPQEKRQFLRRLLGLRGE